MENKINEILERIGEAHKIRDMQKVMVYFREFNALAHQSGNADIHFYNLGLKLAEAEKEREGGV